MSIGRDGLEASDHWATPKALYDKLDAEFHFDFDPCPLNSSFDGLSLSTKWGRSNFVNPPYNRKDKPRFIKRAYDEWKAGATCVLLIPAAVSTKQFHDLIYPYAEVRFIRGRVAFVGTNTKGEKVTTKKGKHDSMIVIFKKGWAKPLTNWKEIAAEAGKWCCDYHEFGGGAGDCRPAPPLGGEAGDKIR